MSETKGKLGLFMLIALVIGNIVGSGAFMLPTDLARVGSIGLLSLLVTVFGALCLALVFAKMSLLIPKTGGPYAYVREGFGEYMGFQTAYYYWIALWVGNAAIVLATMGYLDEFFPVLSNPFIKTISILVIIWSLTIVNIIGVRFAGFFQIVTTVLKFVPFLIIGILGWWYFHPEYLTQNFNITAKSNLSAFSLGMPLTLWLFLGVESATIPAGLVHNPARNIPLATIIGTIVAAIIYILSNTAIFGMLPTSVLAQSTSPFAAATEVIFGTCGRSFVAAIAVIALLGSLNGWFLISAQVPMAAAHDRLFPKIFAKCNHTGIPVAGLVINSICMSLALLVSNYWDLIKQFEFLVLVTCTATAAAYLYTAIVEIVILRKKPFDRKNGFNICVAVLAAAYSFFAILGSSKEVLFYLAVFILLTVPFYVMFKWKSKRN